jgi:hypothetical protein
MDGMSAQLEGFWAAGTGEPDDVLWANVGLTNVPISFAASAVEGSTAYSFVGSFSYEIGETVADVVKFSVSAEA